MTTIGFTLLGMSPLTGIAVILVAWVVLDFILVGLWCLAVELAHVVGRRGGRR